MCTNAIAMAMVTTAVQITIENINRDVLFLKTKNVNSLLADGVVSVRVVTVLGVVVANKVVLIRSADAVVCVGVSLLASVVLVAKVLVARASIMDLVFGVLVTTGVSTARVLVVNSDGHGVCSVWS